MTHIFKTPNTDKSKELIHLVRHRNLSILSYREINRATRQVGLCVTSLLHKKEVAITHHYKATYYGKSYPHYGDPILKVYKGIEPFNRIKKKNSKRVINYIVSCILHSINQK